MFKLKVTTSNEEGAEIVSEYQYTHKWMVVDALMGLARGYIAAAPDIPNSDIYLDENRFSIYNGDTRVALEIC